MRALHTNHPVSAIVRTPGRLQELAKNPQHTHVGDGLLRMRMGWSCMNGVFARRPRLIGFAEMGALGPCCRRPQRKQRAACTRARANHGKELVASTRAHWLASKCEIRTPAVNAGGTALADHRSRNREVAMLVAGGLSNRQIADRLLRIGANRGWAFVS